MRSAAFFDLDKTILATSSALAFTRPFYEQGLLKRADVVKSAYRQFVFTVGGADHDQTEKMRKYLSELVDGWEVTNLDRLVRESLDDLITPTVHLEALDLIKWHQSEGREVVIVSASGQEIVEPVAELLGVDAVIATRMGIRDGRYNGGIEFYAYGENKAIAMREYAAEHAVDLTSSFAYSDSITDLPMLQAVGNPFAVNPDSGLREVAVTQGWPVLTFEKPAALRRPIIDDPEQRKQALIAASVLALVIAWVVKRRKSKGRAS